MNSWDKRDKISARRTAPVARGPSTTRIDGAEEKARGAPAGVGGGGGGGRVLDLIHRKQSPLCWNEDGMKCG